MRNTLPEQGRGWQDIERDMLDFQKNDVDWRGGRMPYQVWYGGDDIFDIQKKGYEMFMQENGGGAGKAFMSLKSMEDADDNHVTALRAIAQSEGTEMITICGKDEADITQFGISEQQEFLKDLGLKESSVERLLLAAYRLLGLINFFTVGEDEVRAWTCRKGEKAPVAAGKIHSDMETGFIRMEVMSYEDLMELGSEANVAKAGKQRIEGREYEVQDGDIVSVRFNRKG